MDPGAAASFYRRKGYTVREGVRATGASGNEHKVPLLAEGPLGSLAVFFGGLDGIDGPEMGGARKVARDLGATPVLAADQFSNADRQTAARLGVVLLDDDAVGVEPPAAAPPPADPARAWPGLVPIPAKPRAAAPEADAHPWPASGRIGGHDGPGARTVDVDDLLAPRRRAEPALAAAAPTPAPAAASPRAESAAVLERAQAAGTEAAEADSFWTMPRRTPQAARAPRPAGATPRPFAWLDGERATAAATPTSSAAEYDGVVAARQPHPEPMDAEPMEAPEERIVRPLTAERMARRARLQRRLVWTLVGAVLVLLFLKWWY